MGKLIHNLRELIWPKLEGPESNYKQQIDSSCFKKGKNEKKHIELAFAMYTQQKNRISNIESKSMVFIGFFGSIVAILSFVLKDILLSAQKSNIEYILIFILAILVIYIAQILKYSIRAIERKSYYNLDEKDFLNENTEKIITNIVNKVKKNYDVINKKVDSMVMAQEFAKRVICIFLFLVIVLLLYALYNIVELNFNSILIMINDFILNYLYYIIFGILFIFLVINLIQIITLRNKLKKLEKNINEIKKKK